MNYRSWMLSYENDVQYLKDRVHVSIFFSWFFRKKCMSIISFLLSNYPKTHYHYFKNIFTSFIFNQFTVHKHSSIKKKWLLLKCYNSMNVYFIIILPHFLSLFWAILMQKRNPWHSLNMNLSKSYTALTILNLIYLSIL